MTFKAKVVADISDAPNWHEPTYEHLVNVAKTGNLRLEMVMSWSGDNEPTLIITEVRDGKEVQPKTD